MDYKHKNRKNEKILLHFFDPFIKSSIFPIGLNHSTIVISTSNSFNQDFSILALSAIPIQFHQHSHWCFTGTAFFLIVRMLIKHFNVPFIFPLYS